MHCAANASFPARATQSGRYALGALSLIWRLRVLADEREVRDVIGLSRRERGSQHGLREDGVEPMLQLMLNA